MNATITPSDEKTPVKRRMSLRVVTVASFAILPAVIFYSILARTLLNLPLNDDYDAVLNFANRLKLSNGFAAKAIWFLASQHNEYKLYFLHAVVWLQFAVTGHVNFAVLAVLGNAFVLLLALLLWKMFLPGHRDLGFRLALFLPVPWLLFQLQYYETVNWAMAGLQNLAILVFSLATIYCLLRPTRGDFFAALICYILAIGSSGNGFLLLPIGLLILASNRRFFRIGAWLIVSSGCVAAYSYRYNVMSSQAAPHHSVFSTLLRLRPEFVLSFMGSAASIPFAAPSFILGSTLCVFFAWLAWRGYVRRNPLVSSCVLFLLLTSIGVAGIRSDLGVTQSLSSRYTIYSALFLIFAWFAIVEEFLQHSGKPLLNNGAYLAGVAVAVLFCLFMDAVGVTMLNESHSKVLRGMTSFEHPNPPNSTEGPIASLSTDDARRNVFKSNARENLLKSIELGIYPPPQY